MDSTHPLFNSVYWAGQHGDLDVYLPVEQVDEYSIVDHGVEHQQYFGGCDMGSYDDMRTGCGLDFNEALRSATDSFEDIARWNCGDIEYIWKDNALLMEENEKRSVDSEFEDMDENAEWSNEFYYYVTVRVKRVKKPVDMNSHLRII